MGILRGLARKLVGLRWTGDSISAVAHARVSQEVRTSRAMYRMNGSYVGGEPIDAAGYVLVTLELRTNRLPSQEKLCGRFGLTGREAEVALLLAARNENREIAALLCISPHTARHHTEQVLSKLGIHSRNDVQAAILKDGQSR